MHQYTATKKLLLLFLSIFTIVTAGQLTQKWQFAVATNKWTNTTTADVWTLSSYTFTKTGGAYTPGGGFVEAWTYNPATTRWSETSVGSNSWAPTAAGVWQEYTGDTTWHYFSPSVGYPRGTWREDGSGALWSYNETNQIWEEAGSSNTKFFPPFLPEQVIVQHQEILSAYNYLTTREIPDGTTNISWEDDYENLVYNYTTGAWTWVAPEYEPTGNATSEWVDNVTFTGGTPAYSERWTITENANKSLGRTYTNTSATVSGGEVMHFNSATNTWSYANCDSHKWSFDPALNEWCNQGTSARYEYNTRARSWHQLDKALPLQGWQSKHDATNGWIWHDTTNDIQWQYSGGSWENLSTSDTYTANGAKLNDGTDNWTYQPAAWDNDNTADTDALFPLLPPNPAGQLGRIQQQGHILADAHVPSGSGYKATYDSLQTDFDAAIALRGTARVSGVNALTTPATNLINLVTPWMTKYLQLSNPHHHADHVFTPATDGTFAVWNHIGWRFAQVGKAAILFQAKGASQLTFGLTTQPCTPLYTVVAQTESNTTIISDSGGTIATDSQTPFIADGDSWYDYWITYESGVLKLGTGAQVNVSTVYSVDLTDSELTLADSTNLNTIQYICFAAQSGAAFEFRNIRSQPLDPTIALAGATGINTRVSDEVAVGGWQDDYDDYDDEVLLVSSKLTTADRKALLATVQTGLATARTEVTTTKTATDTNGYGATDALDSILSRTSFDAVFSQIDCASKVAIAYANTTTPYAAIDTAISELRKKLARNTLSLADFTTQVAGTKEAISTQLATLSTELTTAKNEALSMKATSSSYTALADAMIEELGMVQAQQAALDYFEKYMILQHHELNFNLTSVPTTEQRTALLTAIDLAATTKEEALAAHSSAISAGTSTVFAAAFALSNLLLKNSSDDVRTKTEEFMASDSDRHLIITDPLHTYALSAISEAAITTAQSATQVALEGAPVELVLTANPGTDKPARPEITSVVAETSKDSSTTAAITDQKVTATAGTKETPKNIVFTEQARVEEVVVNTTDKTQGNVKIYTKDATIGLGRTNLTKDSGKALTVLGSSQFIPDGEGVVYVYSDMRIAPNDPSTSQTATPIAAGPNFGKASTDTRCVGALPLAQKGRHKVEFRAPGEQQTIIVGRNVELDLTNFGKGDTAGGQRIVFGKDVSLVLEPGAIIRFPYLEPSQADKAPILEFSGDNARLIFKDPEDRETTTHADAKTGFDLIRNKIMGTGIIRFSGKDSRMSVLRGATVSLEADYTSPRTDIKFEFTGENARLEVGNNSIAGGALQIGNFQDGGYNRYRTDDYPNNSSNADVGFEVRPTQIDCSFTINGLNAHINIGREGFLGFGVGVVNKKGLINGSTANKAATPAADTWQVQPLYNVGNVTLDITCGYLNHSSIGLGDNRNGSVLAIGPISEDASYQFSFNKSLAFPIKPGGNVLYMAPLADGATDEQSATKLHLWDTATTTFANSSADDGIHSLLAPPETIKRRGVDASSGSGKRYGLGSVTNSAATYSFLGHTKDFYRLLCMQDFIPDGKHVPAVKRDGNILIGYVRDNTIKTKNIVIDDVLTPGEGFSVPMSVVTYNGVLSGRDSNTPSRRWTQN